MVDQTQFLYKVVDPDVWEESQKHKNLILGPVDKDFIHLCDEEQIDQVINKWFRHIDPVMVLKLETKLLPGKIVFEASPGSSNKYPHLYGGAIPLDAVRLTTIQNS